MFARRHGQGGTCPTPWKCCKVFCVLAVTVKRSVDQLCMHCFYSFSSAPHFFAGRGDLEGVGVIYLVVLAYVLRATTKKRSTFWRKKVHSLRQNPVYAYKFAHPWKKSCRRPNAALSPSISYTQCAYCGSDGVNTFSERERHLPRHSCKELRRDKTLRIPSMHADKETQQRTLETEVLLRHSDMSLPE